MDISKIKKTENIFDKYRNNSTYYKNIDIQNIFEYNLESELEKERKYIENELNNMENDIIKNDDNNIILEDKCGVYDLIFDNLEFSETIYRIPPKITNTYYDFTITNGGDILNKVYLEITLDDESECFDDFSLDKKMEIFNIMLKFYVGYNQINHTNILTLLFFNHCNDNFIKQNDNIIQIPLYDFSNFYTKGLPLISMQYSGLKLELYNDNNKFKFELCCVYYLFQNDIRKDICIKEHNFLMFSNFLYGFDYIPKSNKYACSNFRTKCLILQFDNNESELYDVNVYDFNNEIVHQYQCDEILKIEIYGIKLYIVPFCNEFSTLDNIKRLIKEPFENITDEYFNPYDIQFNGTDNLCENNIYINSISTNFLRIMSGLAGLFYSN